MIYYWINGKLINIANWWKIEIIALAIRLMLLYRTTFCALLICELRNLKSEFNPPYAMMGYVGIGSECKTLEQKECFVCFSSLKSKLKCCLSIEHANRCIKLELYKARIVLGVCVRINGKVLSFVLLMMVFDGSFSLAF